MKSANREQPPRGGPIRTLVVDDSKFVLASVIEFLAEQPQVEVVGTAADGMEALALMIHRRPDLVVMDLNMPVMDGLQAMRRMREQHPDIRVIIMSMHCEVPVKTTCLKAGANAFVCKDELQHNLGTAISGLFPKPHRSEPPPNSNLS